MSGQMLEVEIPTAINRNSVSSSPPSSISLDTTPNSLSDTPARLTDSESPRNVLFTMVPVLGGTSARRPYKDKCPIQWRDSWIQPRDCHGDKVQLWPEQFSESEGKCNWCQNTFKFDSNGVRAFI